MPDDSWFDISEGLDKLIQTNQGMAVTDGVPTPNWLEIIEFVLCLPYSESVSYLIFFIQKIWAYILIILGYIAVGMALIRV